MPVGLSRRMSSPYGTQDAGRNDRTPEVEGLYFGGGRLSLPPLREVRGAADGGL